MLWLHRTAKPENQSMNRLTFIEIPRITAVFFLTMKKLCVIINKEKEVRNWKSLP